MTTLDGFPENLVRADVGEGRAVIDLDASLYPVEAVYSAAYVFIDRCYVLLDRPEATQLRVVLAPKRPEEDLIAQLRPLVGELANELVSAAWRHRITTQNRAQIEAVTLQAVAGAMGPPTLDDLESFDFTDEAFEDPLGIAMSWEEKYAKKREETAAESPSDAEGEGEGA